MRPRITPVGRPPPPTPPAAAAPARAAPAPRQGGDDYAREHQLREVKRAHGLWFRCGDKYSREHPCKRTGQILMIEVGDFGEILPDDTVYALQLLDAPQAQEPMLLAVVAGTFRGGNTVHDSPSCPSWRSNHAPLG